MLWKLSIKTGDAGAAAATGVKSRIDAIGQNSRMARTLTSARETEISQRLLKHWHEAVPNDRMAHLVKDTARIFLRSLGVRLAQHDVSLGHWTFLRILWEQDGLTQRELSQIAGLMEPTTAVALRSMEALGYVRRDRMAGNRKNMYVFLTAQGRAMRKTLVPLAEAVNALAVQGLKESDIDTTRRTLLVILDNLIADPQLAGGEDEADLPS
ncbi:MAG: transcriptional regulator, MarR family [Ramlibacter sp.]|nr:transcriptional regulator, MarR family [Ramlibacter sp.]